MDKRSSVRLKGLRSIHGDGHDVDDDVKDSVTFHGHDRTPYHRLLMPDFNADCCLTVVEFNI